MAISLDVPRLMEEVEAQSKARDEHLAGSELLLERYPGDWWGKGGIRGDMTAHNSENASFEFLSYSMSQWVWDNPAWRVSTKRPRAQQMVAEAMGFWLNTWTKDSDLKTVLQDIAVDFAFAWGVAHVTAVPRPETYESEDPFLTPQVSRISPWDFGFDSRAPTWRRARMLWHKYRIDKEDLIEAAEKDRELPRDKRAGWKQQAIRELQETTPGEQAVKRLGGVERKHAQPDRKEVEVLEIYLPGYQLPGKPGPDDGFNGTVVTLGISGASRSESGGAVMLKDPRPFFGPRWGPYTVFGAYIVPDSPFPLSLLAATAGHIEAASQIAQAVDAQVASYKRVLLSPDGQLATTIKGAKNEHVYTCNTSPDLIVEKEFGGTTAQNVAAKMMKIQSRDRAMGFAENQRGTTSGDTATDVTYANESAAGRQGYVKSRYADGTRRVGKTVAYYGFHMDEIVSPMGPDAIEAWGLDPEDEVFFVGGSFEDGSGATFDDLGLEIEIDSMSRPSEQKLALQGQVLAQVAQMAPAFPMMAQTGCDVKGWLDAYGTANGIENLSKLWPGIESVDLASIQPAEAQPRLLKDVGLAGLLKGFKGGGQSPSRPQRVGPESFSSSAAS